jgi:hypothetical protein
MTHPLVLGLFDTPSAAAAAARALREMGVARERVSVVARNHDEEGDLADASGASPGSELEDSRVASRLGELSAQVLAAIAVVLPGIGPIVTAGPLGAGLGEAAGHLAGGVAKALEQAGVAADVAEDWERQIEGGAVLIGAHVSTTTVSGAEAALRASGASKVTAGTWEE